MLFADIDLARRIEHAETQLVLACTHSAARRDPSVQIMTMPIAGGLAAWAGEGSPLDKVVGLGFGGVPDDAALEAIEQAYAARGCPVQVELSTLADPAVAHRLTARGYQLVGFENVLGRPLSGEASPPPAEGIVIEPSGADDLAQWLDIVVTGFMHPEAQGVPAHESFPREALERVIGEMASADGFSRYMAHLDGTPAGGASLRISDGIALLCGAATLPAHRRRGIQAALLGARLADASRRGCTLAVMTALPGSGSHHNAQRKGFSLLYSRAVLVREPSADG